MFSKVKVAVALVTLSRILLNSGLKPLVVPDLRTLALRLGLTAFITLWTTPMTDARPTLPKDK
ncbi:hypothetical protein FRC14_000096 [Serendipita sp. 396]|nr:hypothetical protein FRC14_000096 [Serendipita sp. 396]KAG8809191.1 hypothetical protein FRC18_004659 [Serendipita sp. 400]KAG8810954.1 hypothetical protein FRC19_004218 [Serendipita sp. 401]KAG8879504.1 hypothetical protein FRC20_000076 [Serendipita sp. 405]